jgi:hypothetical protein
MTFGEPPIDTVELANFVTEQIEKLPGGNVKTMNSTHGQMQLRTASLNSAKVRDLTCHVPIL